MWMHGMYTYIVDVDGRTCMFTLGKFLYTTSHRSGWFRKKYNKIYGYSYFFVTADVDNLGVDLGGKGPEVI